VRRWPAEIALVFSVTSSCRPAPENAPPPATRTPPAAAAKPARPSPRRRAPIEPAIAALDHKVYIREQPSGRSPEIGVIGLGSSVRVLAAKPVSMLGCERGWYAVEPTGFVCLDATTTLDRDHPLLRAKRRRTGDYSRGSPFAWGESREAPIYRRIPSAAEQLRYEPGLERHLERTDVAKSAGSVPAFLSDRVLSPWFSSHALPDDRPRQALVPTRSTVAFTDEFFAEGRNWVLTPELFVVPKDKLAVAKPSTFTGVHLKDSAARLPLAFIRGGPRPKFQWVEAETASEALIPAAYTPDQQGFIDDGPVGGHFVETGMSWDRLAWVELTGRARRKRATRYLETRETPNWIREDDATVIQARAPEGFPLAGNEKWIDVSIFRGTLVAYEGKTPVFATLISPGLKGYARVDGKPTKNTTPTGAFRIEWKHRSTTMSPNPETMSYYLSEVPYTQFFHMPFALHAAYWHDRFGEPKSGGCVNLSPEDAHFLFQWTTPELPDGWHAVRSGDERGPGTWVRVR